jgi:dsRNA-specific ribonuclease
MLLKSGLYLITKRVISIESKDRINAVQHILKYKFNNQRLIDRVLTISTNKKELSKREEFDTRISNSRLENLGNHLISPMISLKLFEISHLETSQMSQLFQVYTSNNFFSHLMVKYKIHEHLSVASPVLKEKIDTYAYFHERFSPDRHFLGLESNLNSSKLINFQTLPPKELANCWEALVAAVFYDSGLDRYKVSEIFEKFFKPYLSDAKIPLFAEKEFKMQPEKLNLTNAEKITIPNFTHTIYRCYLIDEFLLKIAVGYGTCKKAAKKSAYVNFLKTKQKYKNDIFV